MTHIMSFTKIAAIAASVSLMLMLQTTLVSADGNETKVTQKTEKVCVNQYGAAEKCETKVISEEIVHNTATVEAGFGDIQFSSAAPIFGLAAGALYALSLITQKAYSLRD